MHTGPGNKAIVVGVVTSQVLQGIAGRSAAPPATPAREVRVHVYPSCTRKAKSLGTCITSFKAKTKGEGVLALFIPQCKAIWARPRSPVARL